MILPEDDTPVETPASRRKPLAHPDNELAAWQAILARLESIDDHLQRIDMNLEILTEDARGRNRDVNARLSRLEEQVENGVAP